SYAYIGGDTDESLEAKIGNGSKFEIEGSDVGNNRGKANVGVEITNGKGFNYGAGYSYEFGKDMKNSKVTLGFGYKF
ncbi:MAG: autotransporter outer membrane beta-barrel domain-containing protein, partial [Cetobacterium sp.]